MKSVKEFESGNRLRFEKLASRLKRINVDVVHRVRAQGNVIDSWKDITPETGDSGCHFQDELENCKDLFASSPFKRFYYNMWPLVQSQVELLHHLPSVIDKLLFAIKENEVKDKVVFIQLLAVLTRDVKEELYQYFHQIMSVLIKQIDAMAHASTIKGMGLGTPTPEICAKLFECISLLIKEQPKLNSEYDSLRQYYGSALGHHTAYVREYASAAFCILLRKLNEVKLKKHYMKVIKALSSSSKLLVRSNKDSATDSTQLLNKFDITIWGKGVSATNSDCGTLDNSNHTSGLALESIPRRTNDVLDGISWLLFNITKGIKGQMHSKGVERIAVFFDVIVHTTSGSGGVTPETHMASFCSCCVFIYTLKKLLYHLHPKNMTELWNCLIKCNKLLIKQAKSVMELGDANGLQLVAYGLVALIEVFTYALDNANGRAVSDKSVKKSALGGLITVSLLDLTQVCLMNCSKEKTGSFSSISQIQTKAQKLFCLVFKRFSNQCGTNGSVISARLERILSEILPNIAINSLSVLSHSLFPLLQIANLSGTSNEGVDPSSIIVNKFFSSIGQNFQGKSVEIVDKTPKKKRKSIVATKSTEFFIRDEDAVVWLVTCLNLFYKIHDTRKDIKHSTEFRSGTDGDAIVESLLTANSAAPMTYVVSSKREAPQEEGYGDSDEYGYDSAESETNSESAMEMDENNSMKLHVRVSRDIRSTIFRNGTWLRNVAAYCMHVIERSIDNASSQLDITALKLASISVNVLKWICTTFLLSSLASSAASLDIIRISEVIGLFECIHSALTTKFQAIDGRLLPSLVSLQSVLAHCLVDARAESGAAEAELNSFIVDMVEKLASSATLLWNSQKSKPITLDNCSSLIDVLDTVFTNCHGYYTNDGYEWTLDNFIGAEESDALYAWLSEHVITPSYWIRLSILRIAMYFPPARLLSDEELAEINSEKHADSEADSSTAHEGYQDRKRPQKSKMLVDHLEETIDMAEEEEEEDNQHAHVIDLMWKIASLKIGIAYEREHTRLLSSLEVIVRGNRLTGATLNFVTSFCFGLLNIKFQPVWEPTVLVLMSIFNCNGSLNNHSNSNKSIYLLFKQLEGLLCYDIVGATVKSKDNLLLNEEGIASQVPEETVVEKKHKKEKTKNKGNKDIVGSTVLDAADSATELLCDKIEAGSKPESNNAALEYVNARYGNFGSNGAEIESLDSGVVAIPAELADSDTFYYLTSTADDRNASKKQQRRNQEKDDANIVVYGDARVDYEALFMVVWGLLKRCPEITLRRSKTLVPLFFRFLREQYYRRVDMLCPHSGVGSFVDDVEVPCLVHVGVLYVKENQPPLSSGSEYLPALNMRTLKKRMELFLEIFGSVTSPKSLHLHHLLYQFYTIILSKPDTGLVKLAYNCLCTFKPLYLVPYKAHIKNLMDDKEIRDELLNFDISVSSAIVLKEHRQELIPIIIRIVYGRLVSKNKSSSRAARDQSVARRHAILTFLTSISTEELSHFVHLMIRGILPAQQLIDAAIKNPFTNKVVTGENTSAYASSASAFLSDCVSKHSTQWHSIVHGLVNHKDAMNVSEITRDMYANSQCADPSTKGSNKYIPFERQFGFLYLMEQAIKIFGLEFQHHVPLCTKLLVYMLGHAHCRKEIIMENAKELELNGDADESAEEVTEHDVDAEVDVDNAISNNKHVLLQLAKLRAMCFVRYAEIIGQYQEVFRGDNGTVSVEDLSSGVWKYVSPLLSTLPSSVSSCSKPPALLKLFHAFVVPSNTRYSVPATTESVPCSASLIQRSDVITAIIHCVALPCKFNVFGVIMDILMEIFKEGDEKQNAFVMEYAELLIKCFTAKFSQLKLDEVQKLQLDSISSIKIAITGSAKQEIGLLCNVAKVIFACHTNTAEGNNSKKSKKMLNKVSINPKYVGNLAVILLSMLKTYTSTPKFRMQEQWLLDIISTYKSLLPRIVDIKYHVGFISRLFGPTVHSFSLFNLSTVRVALAKTYLDMANHPSVGGIMRTSAYCMIELTAPDTTLLDTRNYSTCMPIFQGLSGSVSKSNSSNISWSQLLGPELYQSTSPLENCGGSRSSMTLCPAVLHECMRCMYDPEFVTRAAALSALKRFVTDCCSWHTQSNVNENWLDLLTNIVMSELHKALKLNSAMASDAIKKGFVELLAHTVLTLQKLNESSGRVAEAKETDLLHGDMLCLQHIDMEQDFFENIVHIQHHRRMRAFNKLATMFAKWACFSEDSSLVEEKLDGGSDDESVVDNGSDTEEPVAMTVEGDQDGEETLPYQQLKANPFTISSIVNVLLPLAFHPLLSEEYAAKKEYASYKTEAARLIGAACMHLPWTQYYNVLKKLLKELDRLNRKKAHVIDTANANAGGGVTGRNVMLQEAEFELKEKFMLNAVCAVLDAFHFDVNCDRAVVDESEPVTESASAIPMENDDEEEEGEEEDSQALIPAATTTGDSTNVIAQAAIASIYPWVKSFLLKQEVDKEGNKSKVVRPMVAVALTKLISKLSARPVSSMTDVAQGSIDVQLGTSGATEMQKRNLFVGLVMMIVQTLKNRDASARDSARSALARMIQTMGLDSFCAVLYELDSSLTEGYQRHVRVYSIRAILSELLPKYRIEERHLAKNYNPNAESFEGKTADRSLPEFDKCLPLIMKSVMDDLLGEANADRAADGVNRTLIREAKGIKAYDILEECSKYLLFRPTYALAYSGSESLESVSSVHALLNPLFALLLRASKDASNDDDEETRYGSKIGLGAANGNMILSTVVLNRITEALQRVSLGLSKNPTLVPQELLIFVYATLTHCIQTMSEAYKKQQIALGRIYPTAVLTDTNNMDDDDLLGEMPTYLLDEDSDDDQLAMYSKKKTVHINSKKNKDDVTGYHAKVWLPSHNKGGSSETSREDTRKSGMRAAIEERNRDNHDRIAVFDGASAPKLTGFDRHVVSNSRRAHSVGAGNIGGSYNNDSDVSINTLAKFCLTLMYACLKNNKLSETDEDVRGMLKPFLPLLGHCLCLPGTASIAPIAMRCLCTLLSWGLEFEDTSASGKTIKQKKEREENDAKFSRSIAIRMVKLMFRHGTLLSSDSDLVQACLKGITSLFSIWNKKNTLKKSLSGETVGGDADAVVDVRSELKLVKKVNPKDEQSDNILPLKEGHIRLLLQLVNNSILEVTSSFQNAAFQLLRSIIETRIIVPEIYDVMTTLTEQIVLSHRQGIRASSASIVITFIINYPLGDKRLEKHMKQLLKNCEYEFEEGRLAAIELMYNLVKLLPLPVLNDYSQTIFFVLTIRLVNEESSKCRVQLENVLTSLCRRITSELLIQYMDYCSKWLSSLKNASKEHGVSNMKRVGDQERNPDYVPSDSEEEEIEEEETIEEEKWELSKDQMTLVLTGAQVIHLILKARPEICKKQQIVDSIVSDIAETLHLMVQYQQYSKQYDVIKSIIVTNTPEDAQVESGNDYIMEIPKDESPLYNPADAHTKNNIYAAVVYHLLTLLWGCFVNIPTAADYACTHNSASIPSRLTSNDHSTVHVLELVQECMLDYGNECIRSMAVKVMKLYLSRKKVDSYVTLLKQKYSRSMDEGSTMVNKKKNRKSSGDSEISPENDFLLKENGLYQLARRLCLVLQLHSTTNGSYLSPESSSGTYYLTSLEEISFCLVHIICILIRFQPPVVQQKRLIEDKQELSSENVDESNAIDDIFGDDMDLNEDNSDDEELPEESKQLVGINWVMQRLRGIGLDKRGSRRHDVICIFLQLLHVEGNNKEFVASHIGHMLDVAFRANISTNTVALAAEAAANSYSSIASSHTAPNIIDNEKNMLLQFTYERSNELLQKIEQSASAIEPSLYVEQLALLQEKIRRNKAERKEARAKEAVSDPKLFAMRKAEQGKRKQMAKKRKNEKFEMLRGKRSRSKY